MTSFLPWARILLIPLWPFAASPSNPFRAARKPPQRLERRGDGCSDYCRALGRAVKRKGNG